MYVGSLRTYILLYICSGLNMPITFVLYNLLIIYASTILHTYMYNLYTGADSKVITYSGAYYAK